MLNLTRLRELHLAPEAKGKPKPFLSAASGLVGVRDIFYVVADDSLHLARFSLDPEVPGFSSPLLARAPLPQDESERKALKPDLESLALVETPTAHGLLSLGSGSTALRCGGVFVPLDEMGQAGVPQEFDLTAFYQALRLDFPQLNIEGLSMFGDRLLLAQRGNSSQGQNAIIEVSAPQTLAASAAGLAWKPEFLVRSQVLDLGQRRGKNGPVSWTITDLSPLDSKRTIFLATVEDTDNPYDDGEILGSALGVLDENYAVTHFEFTDQALKLEGVTTHLGPRGLEVYAVSDADDPHTAATMFGLQSSIFGP